MSPDKDYYKSKYLELLLEKQNRWQLKKKERTQRKKVYNATSPSKKS